MFTKIVTVLNCGSLLYGVRIVVVIVHFYSNLAAIFLIDYLPLSGFDSNISFDVDNQ
jgi:tryptophan-rich sensory protein